MSEITLGNPSDKNLIELQKLFARMRYSENFSYYWENYLSEMGRPLPDVIIKSDTVEFNHAKIDNKWTLIDIWGTWCKPCLDELPDLQSYYMENVTNKNSNLRIVTFSFGSQNLKEFMSDNEYSFPVIEIDEQTTELFDISGYPTKIIVTPQGTYLTIPFGTDWKMYIRNFTLEGINW
jgi:thiol-disulfide isomerase/thioredoxin